MARSAVTVTNQALGLVGAQYISSLTDGSTNARHAYAVYDETKLELLQFHDWSFATRRATLTLNDEEPGDWKFSYQLPGDFVRVVGFVGYDNPEYQIETITLYSDVADAELRYVADIAEQYYSPMFAQALVFTLAAKLSNPIKNSREMERDYSARAQQYLFMARMQDADNSAHDDQETDMWVDRGFDSLKNIMDLIDNG